MATVITNSTIRIDGNTNLSGTNINVDSATITNLTITNLSGNINADNVNADSATITNLTTTNLSGNINADSATITNLSGTNLTGTNVTATGDIKGSSFNGGQIGGRRNLIINGAMQVNQRGAAGSPTNTSGYQILDRYYVGASGYTIDKKSTDVPSNTGLEYCLSHVRPSNTSGSLSYFVELPETGKAGVFWNGNKVTISCYVKGDIDNTFSIRLRFSTGSGGTDGSDFSSTASVLTLDGTWQKYENTITVDQSVGGSDEAVRIIMSFSNSTNGDETLVTGLQLEVGDTATPFEHRSYGEELALCQRYYEIVGMAVTTTGQYHNAFSYAVPKRTTPTLSVFSGDLANATVLAMPNNPVGQIRQQTNATYAADVAIQANAEL